MFELFLSAEAKFVNSLEENSQACGVPAEAIKQATEGHAKAGQVGKQVCDAAAQGSRPNYWAPEDYQLPGDRRQGATPQAPADLGRHCPQPAGSY